MKPVGGFNLCMTWKFTKFCVYMLEYINDYFLSSFNCVTEALS
jgi:hypothetical protein